MRTPNETFDALVHNFELGLRGVFPIATSDNKSLELLEVRKPTLPDPSDYTAQKEHIMAGKTWSTPVKGVVAVRDKNGKLLDKRLLTLANIPTPTNRHTFILNGKEYQVNYQRRLKPGIYTKFNRLGEAQADFNLAKGRNFGLGLNGEANEFELKFSNSRVPLAPVLKHVFDAPSVGLGAAFDASKGLEAEHTALRDLHGLLYSSKPMPTTHEEVVKNLKQYFSETKMDPSITKITVGGEHAAVDGAALKNAAAKLLAVYQKKVEPSTKEHLAFTEVHGVEDFLKERLEKNRAMIAFKLRPKLSRADTVSKVGISTALQGLVDTFFTTSAQSNHVMQINPLEMKENAYKITSLGEGAIGDTHAISPEVRVIHPSSVGIIDPVRTPDNSRAGVDVRLSLNASKTGKQVFVDVIDARTKKPVKKSVVELYDKFVMQDQEPVENGLVRAVYKGDIVDVPRGKVDFIVATNRQFTVSTTMVPFLQNTHAHRAAMGAKMLGQAVSLVQRESPLVDTPESNSGIEDFLIKSPVKGVVEKVGHDAMVIRGVDGKPHKVSLPNEFPLNGTSFLHAEAVVKVGDSVAPGQLLADNNFSKNGKIALGKNLTVAYLPYKGLNHEDAVVFTQTGASKLTSQHLHTEEFAKDERTIYNLSKFKAHFPAKFQLHQLSKLDDEGVIKVGQILKDGDPIVTSLRKKLTTPEQLILGKANKGIIQPFSDSSVVWDRAYAGKVSAVQKTRDGVKVTITATAPLQEGDKIAGRHGNKGVVSAIIPDHEAPRTADGRIPDVLLNSAGLTSRMNNGQLYEVIAGKALQALGKASQVFPHFSGVNTHDLVTKLRDAAKIKETETLYDGTTGKKLSQDVLMGPMYVLKLFKQAETGFSARSGGQYDIDLRPAKGGEEGAKSVGTLDLYGLLAHGSRAFLKDSHQKSEYNPEMLTAMWRGQPLPPPQPTFAFKKFEAMLGGMGVNLHKEGNRLQLLPMTDKDVLSRSSGQITEALTVNDKKDHVTGLPFRPEQDGLFDTTKTGGLVGSRWSHITLNEPIINPLFKNAARTILGLTQLEFDNKLFKQGAGAIQADLRALDPAAQIKTLETKLKATNSASKKDEYYKQLKYLKALRSSGANPADTYVMKHIPVIPPSFRPIYPDPDTGRIVVSDANQLYKNVLLINQQLAQHRQIADPETMASLRKGLHDAFAKVQGLDGAPDAMSREKPAAGFLKLITGTGQAKDGFFQSKLLSRRQDIAGRGVIVPDTTLGIDEVGMPRAMAMKLYRNHGVGELVQAGMPLTEAAKNFEENSASAEKAVLSAMQKYPTVLTRAPSLHKFNLVGLKPRFVDGKSIRLNTLILKGLNADFDGDAMNVHVPISPEGAADARKMFPSNNLFSPLNRSPVHVPSQETIIGLWKATRHNTTGASTKFKTQAEALAAYQRGEIGIADPITIG